jgi:hypothetical protein
MDDQARILWREPWLAISKDYALKAEAELRREMCSGHILFARAVTAIGFRKDCDDVLFCLGNISPRFAVVHLTYQRETKSEWPETRVFETLEEWEQKCMGPDAEDYAS